LTFDERLDKIKSLYKEGAKGNVTAVQGANQLLEQLRLDYPDHPLAEAYHGSIMLLIARDKTNPLERLKWAKNGLRLLDKAAAAAPQDSRIRYLRGRSAYRLPEKYFQRTRTVIEDYSFLIDQELLQEGHLRAMGIDYSKLTYELGEAFRRIGRNEDAAKCWKKLEQQTQDPEFRLLLRQKLQSLEGKPAIEHIQANESLKSILIGKTARAAGNVLLNWTEKEMNIETLLKDYKKRKEMKKEARRKRHKKEEEMKKEARPKRHKKYIRH
jgi:tetratricopeptide (TPR) repeat protein